MPLSENEQRLLEQMERALYAEDPKWASSMRGAARRPGSARRLLLGVGGVVLGLVVLLVGVAQQNVFVGVLGFLLMLAGTASSALSAQRKGGPTGVVGKGGAVRQSPASRRRRGTFMQRVEERWDRRRDER